MIPFPQGCLSWKALTSLCIVCASCCLKYPVMGPQYITHGRKMSLPPSLLSLCGELIYSSKRNRYWQDSHKARKDTDKASKSIWNPPPHQKKKNVWRGQTTKSDVSFGTTKTLFWVEQDSLLDHSYYRSCLAAFLDIGIVRWYILLRYLLLCHYLEMSHFSWDDLRLKLSIVFVM